MLSPQAALVYTMVVAAEADDELEEIEARLIGDLVAHLPVFRGISRHSLAKMAAACADALTGPEARDRVLGEIAAALTPDLRETAYALARDVIGIDSRLSRAEVGALDRIADRLGIDPETARAIERAAEIRYRAA
jgi:uncharacterized membrane protein YebE (DUF533 family)